MKIKILLGVIFFSCFIISCELTQQNEYYHLDSSYRSLLKTGDTLVYMDSNSKTDTFFVFRKISGTDRVALSGSSCKVDPSAYFDVELLYIIKNKEKVINPYCISFDENTNFGDCANDYYCDETIFFLVSATDGGEIKSKNGKIPFLFWYGYSVHRSDSLIRAFTVLDNYYENVFYYKSDNVHKTDSIQEVYYSYKYGIIQMNLVNGNVLKLIKKMKKISILILILSGSLSIFAQTHILNQEKYWSYRYRLQHKFMVVHSNYENGSGLPAVIRNPLTMRMDWGDCTIYLASYIQTLLFGNMHFQSRKLVPIFHWHFLAHDL